MKKTKNQKKVSGKKMTIQRKTRALPRVSPWVSFVIVLAVAVSLFVGFGPSVKAAATYSTGVGCSSGLRTISSNTVWGNSAYVNDSGIWRIRCGSILINSGVSLTINPYYDAGTPLLNYNNLYIDSDLTINGTLILESQGKTTASSGYGMDITVGGNVTVAATGIISADDKGYAVGFGPGVGSDGSGAGHGGIGGNSTTSNGGIAYDNPFNPIDLGSGGMPLTVSSGGGLIKMVVSGDLINNGAITAKSFFKAVNPLGLGSGGSINIKFNNITGNGSFNADGGDGATLGGGGGAGGRIALIYNTSNGFGGSISSKGGNGNQLGGAGTTFIAKYNSGNLIDKELIISNADTSLFTYDSYDIKIAKTKIPPAIAPGNAFYKKIRINKRSNVYVGSGENIVLNGGATGGTFEINDSKITNIGTISSIGTNDTFVARNKTRFYNSGSGPFNATTPAFINMASSTKVIFDGVDTYFENQNKTVQTMGNLSVKNGALLTHKSNSDITCAFVGTGIAGNGVPYCGLEGNFTKHYTLDISVSDFLLDSLSSVNVNAKGYLDGGPGYNRDGLANSGSGYGGYGGEYSVNTSGVPYGSVSDPKDLGSGGYLLTGGGSGGGIVKIQASSTLTVNGNISSNGQDTAGVAGAASGGSVNLVAQNILGAGSLSASGGNGGPRGNGGGGRIAIVYKTKKDFYGPIYVGGSTGLVGGAGTAFFARANAIPPTVLTEKELIIDAFGLAYTGLTDSTPIDTGTYKNITVKRKAKAKIASAKTITIDGGGSNGSFEINDATLYNAGTISSVGALDSLVVKNGSKFYNSGAGTYNASPAALIAMNINSTTVFDGAGTFFENQNKAVQNMGNLFVQNGALLTHLANSDINCQYAGCGTLPNGPFLKNYILDLSANNVLLDNLSSINVSLKGYGGGAIASGPGLPTLDGRNGAGYGSYGGDYNPGGGVPYGSASDPYDLGSSNAYGDYGGGLVKIAASGNMYLKGSIISNGSDGLNAGGASGGSINLSASNMLISSNSITANGGNTNGYGGGSGGRVAIKYSGKINMSGSVSVTRGINYWGGQPLPAGTGTITYKDGTQTSIAGGDKSGALFSNSISLDNNWVDEGQIDNYINKTIEITAFNSNGVIDTGFSGILPTPSVTIQMNNNTDTQYEISACKTSTKTDISPLMTSNTTPSPYSMIWSDEYNSDYAAWKVFDKNFGRYGTLIYLWLSFSSAPPHYVGVNLGSSKVVGAYSIQGFSSTYGPKDWNFQGSNDGLIWTTLDTQSNILWGGSDPDGVIGAETKTFLIPNTTGYQYYRVYITADSSAGYGVINELKLFEVAAGPTCSCAGSQCTISGASFAGSGSALVNLAIKDKRTSPVAGFKHHRTVSLSASTATSGYDIAVDGLSGAVEMEDGIPERPPASISASSFGTTTNIHVTTPAIGATKLSEKDLGGVIIVKKPSGAPYNLSLNRETMYKVGDTPASGYTVVCARSTGYSSGVDCLDTDTTVGRIYAAYTFNQTYNFYTQNEASNYSAPITSTVISSVTPNMTTFTASDNLSGKVQLDWVNPTDPGQTRTIIVRKPAASAAACVGAMTWQPTNGTDYNIGDTITNGETIIYASDTISTITSDDLNVTPGQYYCYEIFAQYVGNNYSTTEKMDSGIATPPNTPPEITDMSNITNKITASQTLGTGLVVVQFKAKDATPNTPTTATLTLPGVPGCTPTTFTVGGPWNGGALSPALTTAYQTYTATWNAEANCPGKHINPGTILQLVLNDGQTTNNIATATTNLILDTAPPNVAPGNLTANTVDQNQIILNLGSAASDLVGNAGVAGVSSYKVCYKLGSGPITDGLSGETCTTIATGSYVPGNTFNTGTGLSPNADYSFNIFAYDFYGHKIKASEIKLHTKVPNPPFSTGVSAVQTLDSELVNIKFGIGNTAGGDVKLKLELIGPDAGVCNISNTNVTVVSGPVTPKLGQTIVQVPNPTTLNYELNWNIGADCPGKHYTLDSIRVSATTDLLTPNLPPNAPWVTSVTPTPILLDTAHPTVVPDVAQKTITDTQITVGYGSPATDPGGIKEYIICYLKQVPSNMGFNESTPGVVCSSVILAVGYVSTGLYSTPATLLPNTNYAFKVRAKDNYTHTWWSTGTTITTKKTNPAIVNFSAVQDIGAETVAIKFKTSGGFDPMAKITVLPAVAGCELRDISSVDVPVGYDMPGVLGDSSKIIKDATDYIISWNAGAPLNCPGIENNTTVLELAVSTDFGATWVLATTTMVPLDTKNPVAPGTLVQGTITTNTINVKPGTVATDLTIDHYIIYYKTSIGVTEDPDKIVATIPKASYIASASFPLTGLSPGTNYYFNVWAYDQYGHKTKATLDKKITTKIPTAPISSFNVEQDIKDTTPENVKIAFHIGNTSGFPVVFKLGLKKDFPTFGPNVTGCNLKTLISPPFTGGLWNGTAIVASSSTPNPSGSLDFSLDWAIGTDCPAMTLKDLTAEIFRLGVSTDGGVTWVYADDTPSVLDTQNPGTPPGAVTISDTLLDQITVKHGAKAIDTGGIKDYQICYKQGSSDFTQVTADGCSGWISDASYFPNVGTYAATGLTAGTQYSFKVWSRDFYGHGANSAFQTFLTKIPSPPINNLKMKQLLGTENVRITFDIDDVPVVTDVWAQLDLVNPGGAGCHIQSIEDESLPADPLPSVWGGAVLKIKDNQAYSIIWHAGIDCPARVISSLVNTIQLDASSNNAPPVPWEATSTAPGLVDTETPPTPPSSLVDGAAAANDSLTVTLGATKADDGTGGGIERYKIFYKAGSGPVAESDNAGPEFEAGLYVSGAPFTITGLASLTSYTFNIWAYDFYGHKVSASTETTLSTTSTPGPDVRFTSEPLQYLAGANQGKVHFEFQIQDTEIAHTTLDVTLSLVGYPSCSISTLSGGMTSNPDNLTVDTDWDDGPTYSVDWDAKTDCDGLDLSNAVLRIDVEDPSAKTGTTDSNPAGFILDTKNPESLGNLTEDSKTLTAITVKLGAEATDTHLDKYILRYKLGLSVAETDPDWEVVSPPASGTTKTASPLIQNTDYTFNIWAYDTYGNKSNASSVTIKTIAEILTLNLEGYLSGVLVGGETTNISTLPNPVSSFSFGNITPGSFKVGAIKTIGDTNNPNGYTIFVKEDGPLSNGAVSFSGVPGTNEIPQTFPAAGATSYYGYSTTNIILPIPGLGNRFSGLKWAAFDTSISGKPVSYKGSAGTVTDSFLIKLFASPAQATGTYNNNVIILILANL